jgi:hypothetical protein
MGSGRVGGHGNSILPDLSHITGRVFHILLRRPTMDSETGVSGMWSQPISHTVIQLISQLARSPSLGREFCRVAMPLLLWRVRPDGFCDFEELCGPLRDCILIPDTRLLKASIQIEGAVLEDRWTLLYPGSI